MVAAASTSAGDLLALLSEAFARRDQQLAPSVPAYPRPEPVTRWTVPELQLGTGNFSEHGPLHEPVTLVKLLRSIPDFYEPLRDAVAQRYKWGPDRMAGCWALAFLVYSRSRIPDIQPWHDQTTVEFWQTCGFNGIPSYQTVYKRFRELERVHQDTFTDALAWLVQNARSYDERIGTVVLIDATLVETHGQPQYVGPADPNAPKPKRGPAKRLPRLDADTAAAFRHARQAKAELDSDEVQVGALASAPTRRRRVVGGWVYFECGGHIWRSRDTDAGTRAYRRGEKVVKAWHGFHDVAGIDLTTGLHLADAFVAADTQEYHAYPALIETLRYVTGVDPYLAVVDRGNVVQSVYELNAARGITTVAPYRKRHPSDPDRPVGTDYCDADGVPYCKHCGGGTDQVDFQLLTTKAGSPRPVLRVKCAAPVSKSCEGVQEVSILRDPRRLLPVWRTHEAYIEALRLGQQYERVHGQRRIRGAAAPSTFPQRPKRIGRAVHELRALASTIVEWFLASIINGWLGTAPINPELAPKRWAKRRAELKVRRQKSIRKVFNRRFRNGLIGGGHIRRRPGRSGQGVARAGPAP